MLLFYDATLDKPVAQIYTSVFIQCHFGLLRRVVVGRSNYGNDGGAILDGT